MKEMERPFEVLLSDDAMAVAALVRMKKRGRPPIGAVKLPDGTYHLPLAVL